MKGFEAERTVLLNKEYDLDALIYTITQARAQCVIPQPKTGMSKENVTLIFTRNEPG